MSSPGHDHAQLGAYALGALDSVEARVVHEHVVRCPECRREVDELVEMRRMLDAVPPEAFLDGPPDSGELLLTRTLRAVRAESPPARAGRSFAVLAAAAVVVVAIAGGVLIGRQTVSHPVAAPPTTVTAPAPTTSLPANATTAQVTDAETGTTMSLTLLPKKGWVWVTVDVSGLPAGARCELLVVPREGAPLLAGSWLVSEQGAKEGTRLEGTALIDPADVLAVEVATTDGRTMVSVPV